MRPRLRFSLVRCLGVVAALVFVSAGAVQAAPRHFDTAQATQIWGTALDFTAPRILEPASISQMALWGLSGISALDPNLTVQEEQGKIVLYGPTRVLFTTPEPKPDAAFQWGAACAQVAARAFDASQELRRAGTNTVIREFFDELFNHFDPYSRYQPPTTLAGFGQGDEASLGLELIQKDDEIVVGSVAPGGPADQAGITDGMQVIAIGKVKTDQVGLAALQSLLPGMPGTKISITVRPQHSLPQRLILTREIVPQQTVFTAIRRGIGELRVTEFSDDTGSQFASALGALMADNPTPKGIIIDLRGNRGGVLRQAVLSADTLLSHGTIIRTIGRDPAANKVWRAEGADLAPSLPAVILVDGRTASAAEVFSAALADNDRAVVIGSSTLGKGLVQDVAEMPGGGQLFVTWSRMIAPRGWPLQGLGVIPQICTSLGPDSLARQLAALKSGHDLMAKAEAEARMARAPMPLAQTLTIREACPAAIGANDDFRAAETVIDDPIAYKAALIRPLLQSVSADG